MRKGNLLLRIISLLIVIQVIVFALGMPVYDFEFHGKFCGNNVPKIENKTKSEELIILEKISPIDVIDRACQKHDICYLRDERSKKACDMLLVQDMKLIQNKLQSPTCRRLSKSMVYYFSTKNDNPFTVIESNSSFQSKAIQIPLTSAKNVRDTASVSSMAIINYGVVTPVSLMFGFRNGNSKNDEVLYMFPPLHHQCMINR